MKKLDKQAILGLLLVLPSLLLLISLVVIPIIESFRTSLQDAEGNFSLTNYVSLFTQKALLSNMIFTIYLSVISTFIVILLSMLLALFMRFETNKISQWMQRLYFVPIFIPTVIGAYAIINMYGNHGWLASFIQVFSDAPFPRFIFDQKGIVIAFLWLNIPFATMLISSALASVPDSVIESAKDVGAGKKQLLFKIILPMTSQTVLVATTFVFISLVGSFTAPYLIGPNSPQMMGVAMQQIFTTYLDVNLAAAHAVIMFLICSVMGFFYIQSMVKEDPSH